MKDIIEKLLKEYETGKVNRRDLIAGLSALTVSSAAMPASTAEATEPVFQATHLNHIALRVTDIQKAKEFYTKMLGLTPTRESESSCFLTFGNDFLALFKSDEAKMDHYCYSIENYDVNQAAEKLRAEGIEPEIHGNRIYFPDPDGHEVQLAATEHMP